MRLRVVCACECEGTRAHGGERRERTFRKLAFLNFNSG